MPAPATDVPGHSVPKRDTMRKCEVLWTDRPGVLLDNWYDFFPIGDRCFESQLNAFVRFGIYLAVVLTALRMAPVYLLIVPLVMLVAVVVSRGMLSGHFGGAAEGFDGGGCRTLPTPENPFMSMLVTELQKVPGKCPAASVSLPEAAGGVRDTLDSYFRERQWSDPSDVFNKTQSQRAYIVQPSTTNPDDQDRYLKFLYSGMAHPTCKEGFGAMCGLDRSAQGTVRG